MDTTESTAPVIDNEISFARLIGSCMSMRLLVDTATQIFNPFLSIVAAGLGANLIVMGRLVSLRSAMGLVAPLFGAMADKHGYRYVMRIALIVGGCGMLVFASSTTVAMATVGMILAGLGSAGFVPTLQAYMSARLPYARRARGMGILEYSWAFTGIVGLSLMGLLIELAGWRAPFYVLGGGMILMTAVLNMLPAGTNTVIQKSADKSRQSLATRVRRFFILGANASSAYCAIAAGALNFYAAIQLMIVHGAWLDRQYGLTPAQLGFVALILGIFDLVASVSVSIFTDWFGKRRSVMLGTLGACMGYALMPWLNIGVVPAVIGIGIARGFFEFSIVSNLPLLSEQVPAQRGKVMTLAAGISSGAATIATFVAPVLYTDFGVAGIAAVSTTLSLMALYLLWRHVYEFDS